MSFLFQSADHGTLPTLVAAMASNARPRGPLWPNGMGELRDRPGPARIPPAAEGRETARRLWEVSGQLTELRIG